MLVRRDGNAFVVALDGRLLRATVVPRGEHRDVFVDGEQRRFERVDRLLHAGAHEAPEGHLRAPMSGTVITVMAKAGQRVAKGTPLLVLEAMKMEHTIAAPAEGTVVSVHFRAGDRVSEGADLVEFDAAPP